MLYLRTFWIYVIQKQWLFHGEVAVTAFNMYCAMFVPKITKICPTDSDDGLFITWTVPPSSTNIAGYILAFRRSELDLNYSSVTLIGRDVSSHVLAMSRASQRYDIKISAFTNHQFGDFSVPITWCSSDFAHSERSNYLPIPTITKIKSKHGGHSIAVYWKVPLDVSALIVENFLILYKRCGLDTAYKEKLVPGSETTSHVVTGLSECTLYEVRVAACTSHKRGRCCLPSIIRTGVTKSDAIKLKASRGPEYKPRVTQLGEIVTDKRRLYISWTIPDHLTYPVVDGYIIAIRKTSSYDAPYTQYFVRDAQKDSHIIQDVHESDTYEIKIAAYNSFGQGKFTRAIVIEMLPPNQGVPDLLSKLYRQGNKNKKNMRTIQKLPKKISRLFPGYQKERVT